MSAIDSLLVSTSVEMLEKEVSKSAAALTEAAPIPTSGAVMVADSRVPAVWNFRPIESNCEPICFNRTWRALMLASNAVLGPFSLSASRCNARNAAAPARPRLSSSALTS